MGLKQNLRPFVPPILWKAASSAMGGGAKEKRPKESGPISAAVSDRLVSEDVYTLDFAHVAFGGATYFVPKYAEARPACQSILGGGFHEPQTHALVAAILQRNGGNMVHAGTFFGDMIPSFSKSCPGTVYAFEPVLENYVLAKLCVIANGIGNVMMFNAGLGHEVGVTHVVTGDDSGPHRGGSSYIAQAGQPTSLLAIDRLAIPSLAIIQLDVEGFELNALCGAAASIARDKPVIMIEDNNDNCAAFLQEAGYAKAADIPGLGIWVSRDRPEDLEIVRETTGT